MTEFSYIAAAGYNPQPIEAKAASSGNWGGLLRHVGTSDGDGIAERGSYSRVAVVYACIRARANVMAQLPMRVSTRNDELIENGPLVDLVERPAPGLTARNFWRMTEAHLSLFGRSIWHIPKTPGGIPVAVRPLNPLQCTHQLDAYTGQLTGWMYTPAGTGRQIFLSVDETHLVIDPDHESPDRPYDGLSPRQACGLAIRQQFRADVANDSSLKNGCSIGGMLRTDGNLSEEQYRRLREQVEERHGGVTNRQKMMLGEAGLSYEATGNTFAEMEFSVLKGMSREDICASYSVPPVVVGFYTDSNYAHAESAEGAFWTRTMLPHAAWLAEEFQLAVLAPFSRDKSLGLSQAVRRSLTPQERRRAKDTQRHSGYQFYCWFDASSVDAVRRQQLSLAQQAEVLTRIGVPLADILDTFDLGFDRHPWQKTWWKSFGLVDVQQEGQGVQADPAGPPEDPAYIEDPQDEGKASACSHHRMLPLARSASERQLARIWEAHRMSWMPIQKQFERAVSGHFNGLRKKTLANLQRVEPQLKGMASNETIRRDVLGEILFSLVEANDKITARVGPLIRAAASLGGNQAMLEAAQATGQDKPNPFAITDPHVLEKINGRATRIAGINHTLRKQLNATLGEGVKAGETTAQLAARIRKTFNVANSRANVIAMTETGAAVEEARQEGRRQAGTPMKSWLWSRKETGREHHFQTESQTLESPVNNADPFTIAQTGNKAMAPRLSGVAKDDVNCGCTSIARYPGDGVKAVLDRYEAKGFLTFDQLQQRDAEAAMSKDAKP